MEEKKDEIWTVSTEDVMQVPVKVMFYNFFKIVHLVLDPVEIGPYIGIFQLLDEMLKDCRFEGHQDIVEYFLSNLKIILSWPGSYFTSHYHLILV